MKLGIISDMHFGDPSCLLIAKDPKTGSLGGGPEYPSFKAAAGADNDYLVLAGDVFDFSISDYKTAYEYGQVFFNLVKKDGIAKEMIYLAGQP